MSCGTERCEERDSSGGTVTRRFFGQGDQIFGTNYFFTSDHLRSVREMTDSTGAVGARYEYDPYGRVMQVAGDLDSNFRYSGHYYHAKSGLHLTPFRIYDAEAARWLSRDPIQEEGGLNLYAYVQNSPINYIDPLGLSEQDAKRLIALAQNKTDSMTLKGQRTDPGGLNNLLSSLQQLGNWLGKAAGFDGDQAYNGCGDQAEELAKSLNGVTTDDKWEFYHITQKAWWYTDVFPAVHQYLIAKSSNPNDPQIILDPWANKFVDMGGIRGIEKSGSRASGASTIPRRR